MYTAHCTYGQKQVCLDIFMLNGFYSLHTTQPDHRVMDSLAWKLKPQTQQLECKMDSEIL